MVQVLSVNGQGFLGILVIVSSCVELGNRPFLLTPGNDRDGASDSIS